MTGWQFDPKSGVLRHEGRPIAHILSAGPGHLEDTGSLIATLLNWHGESCADTGTGFFAALTARREVK